MTAGSDAVPPHQHAAAVPNTALPPDDPAMHPAPSQDDEESALLRWEGLPADATVLVPSLGPTPMRVPDNAWAMLVLAVDILGEVDPDTAGQVALFAGSWLADQPPADLHDGDLVIRPLPPEQDLGTPDDNHVADVEVLLAYRGRWMPIGRWAGVDERWPWTLAPAVAAAMRLYIDAAETLSREAVLTSERPGSSPLRWAGTVLSDLMSADLVTYGEELVWERCAGEVRHTARLRIDGTFLLADGERVFATPSAAATVLSGKHHHGWSAWRRTSDGRFLADLRAELRARRDR
ncbi:MULTISPECIES: DUF4357 domain-containing protein [Saccharothrix]|uniref:restriction system modified-DNA reader domain-containing protein n=1 Tax=Saccharothrix TaxID=2071 RepID=UPI00093EF12F|nr:DUF4357 domain-containing protein [Saccharothrix sp. CB00851]OKI21710.1 hypothetical protein A6A25_08615 [Saccharothrix sp. CB00851]